MLSILARSRALVIALIFLVPVPLLAQFTGTVRGRVVDASAGRGLADAQVTVSGTRIGALSAAGGEFTLANVPAGPRSITARRIGYQPVQKAANVTSGDKAIGDNVLTLS